MRRIAVAPRPDWREHLERDLGFHFHTIRGAPYWDETACYALSAAQVDELEAATAELERMSLELVGRVVAEGEAAYRRLRIPEQAWPAIERSWLGGEKNLYGRFDLRYDGMSPPKLLEYNADTPTALYEAAVVQWDWLESQWPDRDQFNSLHERLIQAWAAFGLGGATVYFAAVREHAEDFGTIAYLEDTAVQAGLATATIAIEDVGWDGHGFVDLSGRRIDALFKLYPWEWILAEEFGRHLLAAEHVIEPAWKMVLSNKASLALLWELAPGHPNLLRASVEPGGIDGGVVRKPLFGRDGANVQVSEDGRVIEETAGGYGSEGFVYQQHARLPSYEGNFPVIGSWVVASQPAGIGIREDDTAITRDTSRFLPHYFE